MKTTSKLLSLLAILSLSACQAGKVSGADVSKVSSQGTTTGPGGINIGTLSGGNPIDVDPNPTPTPQPTVAPNNQNQMQSGAIRKSGPSLIAGFISLFIADASAALAIQPGNGGNVPTVDKFEIFTGSQLIGQFSAANSSAYLRYKQIYDSAIASGSVGTSANLQDVVSVNVATYNGKLTSLGLTAGNIFDPKVAVITFGSKAWYGTLDVIGAKFVHFGSEYRVIGGRTLAGALNTAIYSLTFNDVAHTFAATPLIATLNTPNCHESLITTLAVNPGIKALLPTSLDASLSALVSNNSSLIFYADANKNILRINHWNMTGVAAPASPIAFGSVGQAKFAAICNATVSKLAPGYTCATAQPAGLCATTAIDTGLTTSLIVPDIGGTSVAPSTAAPAVERVAPLVSDRAAPLTTDRVAPLSGKVSPY